ncbi:MAG: hypothetical protein LBG46_02025 [Elusimicrobiota bacterium]|nr:hypothetical protein [Elusimicrobiota bacterium]
MVKIILITHGDMAGAMLDTASKICPFEKESVDIFTVSGKVNLKEMSLQLKDKIDLAGTLIMVDVFGGTSCNLSAEIAHDMENVNVICGLNLNMLLTAISYRDKLSASDLAKKVSQDGVKSILNVTEKLNEHNNGKN